MPIVPVPLTRPNPPMPTMRAPPPAPSAPGDPKAPTTHISYTTQGTGPVHVLLLPGLCVPATMYDAMARILAATGHFTALQIDNRGMGESAAPPSSPRGGAGYHVAEFASDAWAALDDFRLRHSSRACVHEVGLVGHSMGGMIVQEMVRQRPRHVRFIALLSTHAGGVWNLLPTVAMLRAVGAVAWSGFDRDVNAAANLRLHFTPRFLDAWVGGALPEGETLRGGGGGGDAKGALGADGQRGEDERDVKDSRGMQGMTGVNDEGDMDGRMGKDMRDGDVDSNQENAPGADPNEDDTVVTKDALNVGNSEEKGEQMCNNVQDGDTETSEEDIGVVDCNVKETVVANDVPDTGKKDYVDDQLSKNMQDGDTDNSQEDTPVIDCTDDEQTETVTMPLTGATTTAAHWEARLLELAHEARLYFGLPKDFLSSFASPQHMLSRRKRREVYHARYTGADAAPHPPNDSSSSASLTSNPADSPYALFGHAAVVWSHRLSRRTAARLRACSRVVKLVMTGRHDRVVTASSSRALGAYIGADTVVEVEAAHFIADEAAAEVTTHILYGLRKAFFARGAVPCQCEWCAPGEETDPDASTCRMC